MNRGPITVRYATALFETGREKGVLDRFFKDAGLLTEHCLSVKDFCVFLNNPVIKASRKKEVLKKVLGNEQHPLMIRFIEMVIDKNREFLLADIIRYFKDLYKKHKDIRSVQLITAVSFDQDYLNDIRNYLEQEFKSPIEMEVKVKPEIIGGIVLVVDDKIVDNSIAHQIRILKKKIVS